MGHVIIKATKPEYEEAARVANILLKDYEPSPDDVWAEVMRQVFRGDEPSEGMPDVRIKHPYYKEQS